MEEAAESIDGLRSGAVGLVSGRFTREGGGMAEKPAVGSVGEETCRIWACADGRGSGARAGMVGGVGENVGVCSSASSRSSFSRGERGSSGWCG
jgi:hypothetical protein